MPQRRSTRAFVSLTGPAGNLGDALIRRRSLSWADSDSDEVVAYVGDATDVWLRQVEVPEDAVLLRTKRSVLRWLWLITTAPRGSVLVFEPGEIPLDRGNVMRELVFLTETAIVRLKGGTVIRPPRGIRAPTQPALRIHALAARWSQFALWRDNESAALVGGTRIVPDIGFGAGIRSGVPHNQRRNMIVSLRGNRPLPGEEWVEALRAFAESERLQIHTVVQVREDEQRSQELAQALGGTFHAWGETDALVHEARLRDQYDGARLVISDRMHVLVLAALSGAAPLELVARPTRKITAAFATVGLDQITSDAAALDSGTMQRRMREQIERTDEVVAAVKVAALQLSDVEAEIRHAIQASRQR